ncbi:MAG: 2OG-Fe(II) oxygenase [Mycobacterium kyogaense]|uniref:2OG-Fe(II) oxygenase n=1 Tax=Mycobacterium kyogaense TaxID=2212479 RepID=UPI002FF5ADAE
MKGSVFWLDLEDMPGSNARWIEDVPGVVIDDAFSPRLLASLATMAGMSASSGRTGISNHIQNAFEGFDGYGWRDEYFEQVRNGRDDRVEEFAEYVRRHVARIVGLSEIRQAHDAFGRMFTTAVVRQTNDGIDWHFDDAHREYPKTPLDLGPGSRCLSWITYLNSPQGGQLEIAKWRPADAGEHPKRSYPLNERRFTDAPRQLVQPVLGRSVLVSSEYAHRVHPTVGPRKFITMFIVIGDGEAITFG